MTQQANFTGPRLDIDATRAVIDRMEKKRVADVLRGRHMFDHLRHLTPADYTLIRAHIAKHAPDGVACLCNARAWQIEAVLTIPSMVQTQDGQTKVPSRLVPTVTLNTTCCGEVRFLDAVAVGLLPVENLTDEMMETIARRVLLEAPKPAG